MAIRIWIVAIIATVAVYALVYILRRIIYSGTDAITNAYKRKKNQENPENLSDRYKK